MIALWFAVAALVKQGTLQCKEVTLRSVIEAEACMRTRHYAVVPHCTFESRAITRQVNAIVEAQLKKAADYDEAIAARQKGHTECDDSKDDRTYVLESDCDAPFRVADVVSYPCRRVFEGGRSEGSPWPINVQLGATVRELELADLLVDAAAERRLWELVRADLRQQLKEQNEGPETEEDRRYVEERLEANTQSGGVNLTPDGLRVSYHHSAFGWSIIDATIPYAQLHGILQPRLIPTKP